jgi:chromosome segregation ATPase
VMLEEISPGEGKETEYPKAPVNQVSVDTTTAESEDGKTSTEEGRVVPESTKQKAFETGKEKKTIPLVQGDTHTNKPTPEPHTAEIAKVETVQGDNDEDDSDVPAKSHIPEDIAKELELLRRELQEASREKAELHQLLSERENELKQCQDQIENLESEIEKQLEDWGELADKLLEADSTIKSLMEEVQEVDGLKQKLHDHERLRHDLEEANQKLSMLEEKDGEAVMAVVEALEGGKKLDEKDEEIAGLRNELDPQKREESVPPSKLDFTTLNTSLARFSEEISLAMSELEEAQKKLA